MKSLLKIIFVFSVFGIATSSCKKDCYTCEARLYDNLVDFDDNCGSDTEKEQMESAFRKQYPDSVYFVRCY